MSGYMRGYDDPYDRYAMGARGMAGMSGLGGVGRAADPYDNYNDTPMSGVVGVQSTYFSDYQLPPNRELITAVERAPVDYGYGPRAPIADYDRYARLASSLGGGAYGRQSYPPARPIQDMTPEYEREFEYRGPVAKREAPLRREVAARNRPVFSTTRRAGVPAQSSTQSRVLPKQVAKAVVKKTVAEKSTAPVLSQAKTLALQLKKIGNDYPVIGLKFVTEFITEYDDGKSVHYYRCNLCDHSGDARQIMQHVLDYVHRTKYIEKHKLEPANDKKDVEKRAAAIEQVHGRGTWAVERERKAFVAPSKVESAIATMVGKVNKEPVDKDQKRPAGTPAPGAKRAKEGDVKMEEDEMEPGFDPKLFVLSELESIVSQNFTINSDLELTVVDSILTHMMKAVKAYQWERQQREEREKATEAGVLVFEKSAKQEPVDEPMEDVEAKSPEIDSEQVNAEADALIEGAQLTDEVVEK